MIQQLKVKQARDLICIFILSLMIILTTHYLLIAGLSCVDQYGCQRDWCKQFNLYSKYDQIVKISEIENNCQ